MLRSALGPELIPGPVIGKKAELKRLAMEAYGRTASHFLRCGMDALSELDQWRMYPTLDGLRVLAMDDLQDPETQHWFKLICAIYGYWRAEVGWRIQDLEDDNTLDYRFAGAQGYLLGMQAGSAIESATDILAESPASIRHILLEQNKTLDEILRSLERSAGIREISKSEVEGRLAEEIGDDWRRIDPITRQSLIEGDVRVATGHNTGEQDFGHVVTYYSRAVEKSLAPLFPRAKPGTILGHFGDRENSPFRRSLRAGAPVDDLISSTRELSARRNDVVHPRTSRRGASMSYEEINQMRRHAIFIITRVLHWTDEPR
jgi:hypothetical protein